MKVVLTSSGLGGLGGTQSFLKDLARALMGRGHEIAVFSSDPDDHSFGNGHGFPVTSSTRSLPFKPDIIHGQHHLSAMTAILGLPGTPAIYHCHGAVWRECPPRHPRILHYLAMSSTLAFRMEVESNIPPADISVFLNTVDLNRFSIVRKSSATPRKALFYNKIHTPESPTVIAVRQATESLGITLEFAGRHFGRLLPEPEKHLPEYDIVFASGKSAIDAIASGCAVVVLGRNSCGELVRPDNYARLRAANFSLAVNSAPPCQNKVRRELQHFTAAGTTLVASLLRDDADLDKATARLVCLYDNILARHSQSPTQPTDESIAIASYLRGLTPIFKLHESVAINCDPGITPQPPKGMH